MTYLPEKLDEIAAKVSRLIQEQQRLTQANADLMEENNRLKFRLAEATQNNQLPNTKTTDTTQKIARLQEKIDQYTAEVEECIEYLSKA